MRTRGRILNSSWEITLVASEPRCQWPLPSSVPVHSLLRDWPWFETQLLWDSPATGASLMRDSLGLERVSWGRKMAWKCLRTVQTHGVHGRWTLIGSGIHHPPQTFEVPYPRIMSARGRVHPDSKGFCPPRRRMLLDSPGIGDLYAAAARFIPLVVGCC